MKKQNTLIIGLGVSGRSAAKLLLKENQGSVVGVDANAQLLAENEELIFLRQAGLETLHESALLDPSMFDLVVVSPGIPQNHPLYLAAQKAGVEIVGEVELACRKMRFNHFLAVTGTNGKTTVTLLVTHILNHSGRNAEALGNVGTPITSTVQQGSSSRIIVAELSSYQLETMHTKIIDAGVLLNITPDHLDRYLGMEHYAAAKLKMIDCLKASGVLYIEETTEQTYRSLIKSTKSVRKYGYSNHADLYTDLNWIYEKNKAPQKVPESLQAKRSHDLENLLAAYALCSFVGVTPQEFFEGYKTFKKPSHRIEFVTKIHGVSYYDDSKGTNLDAVIRAVETVDGAVILIAGGVDKGAPYTPWIAAFNGKVRLICAIGQAAPKMERELGKAIPVKLFATLEEAVNYAAKEARSGENVMLSPGCSSFDMFKDYAHRGREFQKFVTRLRGE